MVPLFYFLANPKWDADVHYLCPTVKTNGTKNGDNGPAKMYTYVTFDNQTSKICYGRSFERPGKGSGWDFLVCEAKTRTSTTLAANRGANDGHALGDGADATPPTRPASFSLGAASTPAGNAVLSKFVTLPNSTRNADSDFEIYTHPASFLQASFFCIRRVGSLAWIVTANDVSRVEKSIRDHFEIDVLNKRPKGLLGES